MKAKSCIGGLLLGLVAVSACSNECEEASSSIDAPTAGGSCSVTIQVTPEHPEASDTVHAHLVLTGCSGHPVGEWFVTGPRGPVHADSDMNGNMSFSPPAPGIYTITIGYMLDTRSTSSATVTVEVC